MICRQLPERYALDREFIAAPYIVNQNIEPAPLSGDLPDNTFCLAILGVVTADRCPLTSNK
ncbi:hypothetical protein D3C80_1589920 [compost metagenome]